MTAAEYLSESYFPLSTQPGLEFEDQAALDAANYDEYTAAAARHEQMTDRERQVGRELEAKHAARGSVIRSLKEGTPNPHERPAPQGPGGQPLM